MNKTVYRTFLSNNIIDQQLIVLLVVKKLSPLFPLRIVLN